MAKSKTTRSKTTTSSSSNNDWIGPAVGIGLTVATKALPKIWDSIFGDSEPKEQERVSYEYDRSDDYWYNECQNLLKENAKFKEDAKAALQELKAQIDEQNEVMEDLMDGYDKVCKMSHKQKEYFKVMEAEIEALYDSLTYYYNASWISLVWTGIKRLFTSKPSISKEAHDKITELLNEKAEIMKEVDNLLKGLKNG